jgi:uncharacterized protein (TIGR02246 family)
MTRWKLQAFAAAGLMAALAVRSAATSPPPPGLEKELRAQAEKFAAGWNAVDAKAMAALFVVDGDLVNPFGHAAKGRTGIEKFFANELSTATKGTHFAVKELSPQLLRPDLAVEDLDVEISGGTLAPDPAKPFVNHAFLVLKRQGGQWLIVSLRAYSYMQPPPPPPAR